MKYMLILATSLLGVSCATQMPSKRTPASVGEPITETKSASFAIKENGIKISEMVTTTLAEQSPQKVAIEVEKFVVDGIRSVDGTFVNEYRDGDDPITHKRGGKITVIKDWSSTSEFYKWRKAVLDGRVDRKSMSVVFMNDRGEERRVTFFECWPTKWTGPALNAKNSGHASESIEIEFESYEMK